MKNNFKCEHCGREVSSEGSIGTNHRNHCPFCLWSKHLGQSIENKRLECSEMMEPIGLTFKQEGMDKYGKERRGEIMIIHRCTKDGEISINRLASDDNTETIMKVFEESQILDSQIKEELEKIGIRLLNQTDKQEIRNQLFGKTKPLAS